MLPPVPNSASIWRNQEVAGTPPDLFAILARVADNGRVLDVLGGDAGALRGEYLTWDKLRHKTPPDGLSAEEWWLAVRWARRNAQRDLPLLIDSAGHPFNYTLPDAVLREIDFICTPI